MIRFVSYNTQFCTGLDGRTDVDRIADEIRGADVMVLQEIERHWKRTGEMDQVAEIVGRFPDYYWAYGPGIDVDASYRDATERLINRRRQFGNMVLARWPLTLVRNHLLPKLNLLRPMSLQRSALETVVALPDGPCQVVAVHLAHASRRERKLQVERLLEILRSTTDDGGAWSGTEYPEIWSREGPPLPQPRRGVIMGDFNLIPGCEEHTRLCGGFDARFGCMASKDSLVDAWQWHATLSQKGATWGSENGTPARLDYAFVTPDLAHSIHSLWVAEDANGSDHKPLWLELALPR